MLQVMPKWKVVVLFQTRADVVFWMYDSHLSNVQRAVANMQFTENGLDAPKEIRISLA